MSNNIILVCFIFLLNNIDNIVCNSDAKRLYDDLMSKYNRLVRPVNNNSDTLTVIMGLKLSQLIEVNLKNQIMTTNVWVIQEWLDNKLKWEPEEYGGVRKLYVPAEEIWLPDIVLYNNADGNYEVTILTKAILHFDGLVVWKPPAIYKSSCEIDVEYFPFDQQTCFMKFGSWTYDGYTVDLKHKSQSADNPEIKMGMDLTDFYLSVEWDIMAVPAKRREKFYSCCEEPYPDITFNITLRRKTLFYTVNLIIPCIAISFLSILVFYLPSDSGEKVSLSISIMLSLGVFFLLLAEIIPPTSLTVPLLGRYLLFTMVLVTFSVVVTIAVLNVNFRSPSTHRMAPWVRRMFIEFLPKMLCMERPIDDEDEDEDDLYPQHNKKEHSANRMDSSVKSDKSIMPTIRGRRLSNNSFNDPSDFPLPPPEKLRVSEMRASFHPSDLGCNGVEREFVLPSYNMNITPDGGDVFAHDDEMNVGPVNGINGINATFMNVLEADLSNKKLGPEIDRALLGTRFIAQHHKNLDNYLKVEEDWKYVAMVLDRLFLWIFTAACIIGTAGIILQAPSLYDDNQPIDVMYSKVGKS